MTYVEAFGVSVAGPIPEPPPELVEPAVENNPKRLDLREEAARWIEESPKAYALFERFALEAASKGKRFGVGLIAERVRWEGFVSCDDDQGFKVNNNHRAYLARKLLADHPQLEGLLRFRQTRY